MSVESPQASRGARCPRAFECGRFGLGSRHAKAALRQVTADAFPALDVRDIALTPMPTNPACWEGLVVGVQGERYRVLRANGDPRAEEVLEEAHNLLQERAAKITDEELRRSFLENVSAHREIISELNATSSR